MSYMKYCAVVFALLVVASSGSKPQSDGEKEVLLEEKVQELTKWSNKRTIIRMNGGKFREYATSSPRNYSVIIMLTALQAQRQCEVCREANEEYKILTNSWRQSQQYSNHLFFAMVDYDDGPDVFKSLKINSVPVFMHFPAKGKPKKADTMLSQGDALKAEEMAKWVLQRTGVQIQVLRPINYAYIMSVVAVLCVSVGLLYYLRNKLHLVFNRNCWAAIVLLMIFAMISGHMWNRIRKPPNKIKNPRTGEMIYIHPSRGTQLVMETYIIMLLHGSVVIGFIMMNEIGSLKWRWAKIILALAGLACVIVFFIILLTVFKIKHPYYPYGFFDLLNKYVWKS